MPDYLTLSWARFSKDVQSHALQISKILSHPAPRAGDLIKLDASAMAKSDAASAGGSDMSLEVIARFPGGLDFGCGLVDINFAMWPLFKTLNIDNILTICEVCTNIISFDNVLIALKDCAGSDRENSVLFSLSCHAWGTYRYQATGKYSQLVPDVAVLQIAVSTIKYLVELRGWNGIALQAVHSRDAKIYIDDPGPWILGFATEARYSIQAPSEVCICGL